MAADHVGSALFRMLLRGLRQVTATFSRQTAVQIIDHAWGSNTNALGVQPDIIIGSDIVYQQEHFDGLIGSLWALSLPHTLTFLSFRLRGKHAPAMIASCSCLSLQKLIAYIIIVILHPQQSSGCSLDASVLAFAFAVDLTTAC